MILETIKKILNEIETSIGIRKVELIKEVQNLIWNDESIVNDELNDLLSSFAYDIDFYEPDDKKREESSSYFGNQQLLREIKVFREKLDKF